MELRPDRTGTRGLKVAVRGDLIEDIHRQQRRRVIKRAVQFASLAIALLLVGWGFKVFADRRARTRALDSAREQFMGGTVADVRSAVDVLEHSLERNPSHEETQTVHALAQAHLWLEFGVDGEAARQAVDALDASTPAATLAQAILAFASGDVEQAGALLQEMPATEDDFVEQERAWLVGLVAAASGPDDQELRASALERLQSIQREHPRTVSLRRVMALLLLLQGQSDEALAELEEARSLSRSHLGLAADEALYNAYLHQELGGVASVADQLLSMDNEGLSPRDRAHAELARAVAHVRNGEPEQGVELLKSAWPKLADWNHKAHELAIVTALEAGAPDLVQEWLPKSGLGQTDRDIYEAWITLARGDVMKALEQLAELPQEEPWVGYLQALALVEQGRYEEAKPWLERTEKLLPGRTEVEVARARVELRLGDPQVALRKLQALAEEEPHAPRAYTGLGEAYLRQPDEERDLSGARKALQKAIEREPVPAEAMLQLAEVWNARRLAPSGDEDAAEPGEARSKAKDLLTKAAEVNPHLPRYRERLALFLADLDHPEEALAILRNLEGEQGVSGQTLIAQIELELAQGGDADFDELLERAEELGADPRSLERARARVALSKDTKESVARAQEKLAALLDEDQADVESRVLYAETHLRQFDRKAAEAAITRGFSTTPDEQQGRLHFALARIQARTGAWSKAAPRARRAWNEMLDEGRPAAELLEVAELATRAWSRQNKDRTAVSIAEELTRELPGHARAWMIRAATELLASNAAAARSSAEQAIELNPDHPRAHAILGDTLLRFGYKDKAAEAYHRAIELAEGQPDEKDYRDKLKRL